MFNHIIRKTNTACRLTATGVHSRCLTTTTIKPYKPTYYNSTIGNSNNTFNIISPSISSISKSFYSTNNSSSTTTTTSTLDNINNKVGGFGFNGLIDKALNDMGIVEPTAIQKKAMQPLLRGNDMFVMDGTGTGKSFVLMCGIVNDYLVNCKQHADSNEEVSIKQNMKAKGSFAPKYLVVTPTRELAWQIGDWVRQLSKRVGIELLGNGSGVQLAIKGISDNLLAQELVSTQPEVLIGTPNVLHWLLVTGKLDYTQFRMLIVDEADLVVQALAKYTSQAEKMNRKIHPPEGVLFLNELNRKIRQSQDLNVNVNPTNKTAAEESFAEKKRQVGEIFDERSLKNLVNSAASRVLGKEKQKQQQQQQKKKGGGEEEKMDYVPTYRHFQTIFTSATLNMRNRAYIESKGWVDETRVYVMLREQGSMDHPLPKQFTNRFISVQSEEDMLEAIAQTWNDLILPEQKPDTLTEAVAVIASDGSITKVVDELRARGINAKPLTDRMNFDKFNIENMEPAQHDVFVRQVDKENRDKQSKVNQDVSKRKNRQEQREKELIQHQLSQMQDIDETTKQQIFNQSQQQPKGGSAGKNKKRLSKESAIIYIGKENSIRGIDISGVEHVYILNVEISPTSYLHMAGRSGRMNRSGNTICIYNSLLSRKYENVMKFFSAPFEEVEFTIQDE
ncbi:hypothetical protein DFA_06364 [Cavenderia fasciculata]|uniref:RNA helicase n=1 Tax=Cavenderia fasciculata TaxID=261658 RepID=F4PKU3_CACFS|nr:uncharacterized protein DFA_06364 [Cavenderia fasciculata]EGG24217.1 hypothetical protein DFA_06364 [Cavenderia fasciculata]|eukprot:XP_004362068.1 hypothetical protein DFA_06364 [Cavenderia fasciculata]